MALLLILLIRVATDWQQKSLGFFFGFQGVGLQRNDPYYEMSSSFPQLDSYYGLLSGLAYNLPYSICGLFAGYLTKSKHRSMLLGIVTVLVSSFHLTTGITNSFGVLVAMRFLHGAICSVTGPLSYSLVADYFAPEVRGTANAILSTGSFIGIALSSISILCIKSAGWRNAYIFMGSVGILTGLLGMTIKSPKKYLKRV
jgi:MFS family permease